MAVDVVYRAKNDVVAARRTRCARFVTDRYNLVRRGSRDAPGCTRGTIVSQVTVSSFMHGRNHYPRLCIRVNGNTCFRSLLPHCSSPSLFLLLPRYRMLPPQQKFQFQFPNPSCYQTSCKYAASVHYCKQKYANIFKIVKIIFIVTYPFLEIHKLNEIRKPFEFYSYVNA